MKEKILAALATLSAENADHWTGDGLPRLDVLNKIVGSPVTRQQVTEAAPGFSKSNTSLEVEGEKPVVQAQASSTPQPQTAVATPAADLQPEAGQETEVVEGSDEAIEKELAEAQAIYAEAGKRLKAARDAMDVVIARREHKERSQDVAANISDFQKSQQAQRKAAVMERLELQKLLAERRGQ